MTEEAKGLIEAALFLAEEGLGEKELRQLAEISQEELEECLHQMEQTLDRKERGLRLLWNPPKVKLAVKPLYLDRVRHLAPHQDISTGVLRTLSVIAYNTPVLQKEVIDVRGNGAYDHIDELIERGFVNSQKEGRTKLLSVTDKFLDYFDLDDPSELKEEIE